MPEKDYVIKNGKIYCYNSETRKIDRYTKDSLDFSDCPEGVIEDLMALLSEKRKQNTET